MGGGIAISGREYALKQSQERKGFTKSLLTFNDMLLNQMPIFDLRAKYRLYRGEV